MRNLAAAAAAGRPAVADGPSASAVPDARCRLPGFAWLCSTLQGSAVGSCTHRMHTPRAPRCGWRWNMPTAQAGEGQMQGALALPRSGGAGCPPHTSLPTSTASSCVAYACHLPPPALEASPRSTTRRRPGCRQRENMTHMQALYKGWTEADTWEQLMWNQVVGRAAEGCRCRAVPLPARCRPCRCFWPLPDGARSSPACPHPQLATVIHGRPFHHLWEKTPAEWRQEWQLQGFKLWENKTLDIEVTWPAEWRNVSGAAAASRLHVRARVRACHACPVQAASAARQDRGTSWHGCARAGCADSHSPCGCGAGLGGGPRAAACGGQPGTACGGGCLVAAPLPVLLPAQPRQRVCPVSGGVPASATLATMPRARRLLATAMAATSTRSSSVPGGPLAAAANQ